MTAIRKEARSHGVDENNQSGSPGLTGKVLNCLTPILTRQRMHQFSVFITKHNDDTTEQ